MSDAPGRRARCDVSLKSGNQSKVINMNLCHRFTLEGDVYSVARWEFKYWI